MFDFAIEHAKLEFNKDEFYISLKQYNDDGGHKYDDYDLNAAWEDYRKNPQNYDWLPRV